MADKAQIRIGILFDELEAQKTAARVEKTVADMQRIINKANQVAATEHGGDTVWTEQQKQVQILDEHLNKLLDTARKYGHEQQFITTMWTKGPEAAEAELNKLLGIQTKSNALTKEEIKLLQQRATELRHESIAIRRAAMDLRLFSEAALIAGTGVITGMVLMADQFAKANKEGDAQAAKYTAAMDRVKASQNEVGRQFSIALLPFLAEATKMLDKASAFLKANPEVATAAIKGAEILIGVGAIGKSVATAARLTADFLAIQSSIMRVIATRASENLAADKQVAAAKIQDGAADKQIVAAEAEQGAATTGGAAKGVGGLLGFASSTTGIIALITASILVSNKIVNQLDQMEKLLNDVRAGFGSNFRFVIDQLIKMVPGGQFVTMIEQLKLIHAGSKSILTLLGQWFGVVQSDSRRATTPAGRENIANRPIGSVAESKKLDELLQAYQNYMDADLELVQKHYAKRQEIISQALEDVAKENARNAKTIADINSDLQKKLTGYTEDYNKAAAKDLQDYLEKRSDVVRDADEDVLRIEQDLRDKLAKMAKDHAERQGDLLAARDALGLVKEQRRYQREQDEAIADANKDIARRRQDIAKRLADIDREYAEEKKRRLADYQERVLEAKQQAADRAKEEAIRHQEELDQIRKNEAEKLAEEQKNFIAERKRNYDQFIARIKDLDAFYLGVRQHEKAARDQMIQDLDAFLAKYRGDAIATYTAITNATKPATGTTGTVGHRAGGGYVGAGTYKVGEQGKEFVLSNQTTKAAEQAISGQLNQQNLMAALQGKKTTIVWNDQRTFDGRITAAERRAITQDTIEAIERMLS